MWALFLFVIIDEVGSRHNYAENYGVVAKRVLNRHNYAEKHRVVAKRYQGCSLELSKMLC